MPPVTSEQVQQLIIATIAIQVAIPFAKWSAEKWFTRFEKTDDDLTKAFSQLSAEVRSEIKGLAQLISEIIGTNRVHDTRVSQIERLTDEFRESLKEHHKELKAQIDEVRDEVRELAERVK